MLDGGDGDDGEERARMPYDEQQHSTTQHLALT